LSYAGRAVQRAAPAEGHAPAGTEGRRSYASPSRNQAPRPFSQRTPQPPPSAAVLPTAPRVGGGSGWKRGWRAGMEGRVAGRDGSAGGAPKRADPHTRPLPRPRSPQTRRTRARQAS